MTKTEAVTLFAIKRYPGVSGAQLRRQKDRVCTAARKWRQAQPVGMTAKISELAGVSENAIYRLETGHFYSANILRAYFRAGFDPAPLRLINALKGISEGAE